MDQINSLSKAIKDAIPPVLPTQSTFGNAPSLRELKKMSKEKRKQYRGAHFWYYFRVYYPYVVPCLLLIFMIVALAAWNTVEGHLVLGSVLSLVSSVSVISSYLMIVPWRKHPSSLILYRTLSSIVFSVNIILNAISSQNGRIPSCRNYSVVTQMMLLAGEGWLTTIANDLVSSLTNPFTSYKQNLQRYQILVWGVSGFIAFTLFFNPRCQGEVDNGICWLNISMSTISCLWGYYLFWILCMYCYQIWAAGFAYFRLKKGLPATFEIRKQCAIETFRCLMAYAMYLSFVMLFFMVISSQPSAAPGSSMNNFALFLLFVIANKGTVDGIVWFSLHDFNRDEPNQAASYGALSPNSAESAEHDIEDGESARTADHASTRRVSLREKLSLEELTEGTKKLGADIVEMEEKVKKKMKKTITELADIAIEELDEADLSPQVNMALRQQIVQYVTSGVKQAVHADREKKHKGGLAQLKESTWSRDPAAVEGIDVTEFALEGEYPFKSYGGDIFRSIREHEGISDEQYLKILSSPANERLSEGASGAFMFFCGGGEYIVKTIRDREARVLHNSLKAYTQHLRTYKKSFLCRFIGSYSLAVYSQTFYFVVMMNCFNPSAKINEKYDLKGSWVGRSADPSKTKKRSVCRHCNTYFVPSRKEQCSAVVGRHEANIVLKDNDMRTKITLQASDANVVVDMIKKDSALLGQLGVMDYSLLVGIKKRKFPVVVDDASVADSRDYSLQTTFKASSVTGPALYYLGIVDFLQDWTFAKRVERAFKIYILRKDPEGLSVMEPIAYMERFQGKIDHIFAEDPDSKGDEAPTRTSSTERVFGSVGMVRTPSHTEILNPMLSEVSLDTPDHSRRPSSSSLQSAAVVETGPRALASADSPTAVHVEAGSVRGSSTAAASPSPVRAADRHPFRTSSIGASDRHAKPTKVEPGYVQVTMPSVSSPLSSGSIVSIPSDENISAAIDDDFDDTL